jgi:uncharacterized protein
MISIDVLKKIIVENKEYISSLSLKDREIEIENNANYVFIGPRRCGKTFFLYQIIKNNHNINQDYLFINFEDERLIEFNSSDFELLLEAYNQLYQKPPVLFFDEIQNIKGWDKFCRRLADKDYKIYVTGSNAKMLSSEMATVLGGRFLIRDINVLSFSEFVNFNGIVPKKNFQFSTQKTEIVKLQEEYLKLGGLPESLNYNDKRNYLSNIFQKVFFGDIIARHKLKNDFALKLLIKKLAESVNNETSFNRIKNIIKSVGIKVGTSTLIEYFNFLEEAFLVFSIKNYTAKFSERENKKKFYFIDTGILNLFLINQDSKLLENLVYLQLRRNFQSELYYFKRNYETDFYLPEKNLLIQVSYTIKDYETRKRELNSLKESMKELYEKTAFIITYDEEEVIKDNNTIINVIPYWKWVLTSNF